MSDSQENPVGWKHDCNLIVILNKLINKTVTVFLRKQLSSKAPCNLSLQFTHTTFLEMKYVFCYKGNIGADWNTLNIIGSYGVEMGGGILYGLFHASEHKPNFQTIQRKCNCNPCCVLHIFILLTIIDVH